MKPIHFHIITLFPEAIDAYLKSSILGRAQSRKLIKVTFYQLRDFNKDKHKRVDDRPYAGGPGMVLRAEPIINAVQHILKKIGQKKKVKVILFSTDGKQFTNPIASNFAKKFEHIILIAGRYEGVDARVKKILKAEEISIGPYVLTGGELPGAVLVDSITRHIPGVLGKDESLEERRISSPEVYTRPEILLHKGKKYKVPKVLLSGNHKKIDEWKRDK